MELLSRKLCLLKKYGIYFEDFVRLEDCGLVSSQTLSLKISADKDQDKSAIYTEKTLDYFIFLRGKRIVLKLPFMYFLRLEEN